MPAPCSQKSAPVCLTVISYVTTNPAEQGLLIIPPIVGQLLQIFLGAFIAKPIAAYVRTGGEAGGCLWLL